VSPRDRVLRGGSELEIPSESVVRGDLLLLRDGEIVQADGVVGAQASLSLDESQLTGESEPQPKQPGDPVFAGSVVLGGQGVAEVTQTGPRTRYGRVAELVAKAVPSPTPLQRKTSQLVRRLGAVALLLAIAMALYSLWRGEGIGRALLAGISLAMAALPEEFPLVLALFLSVGAYRLSRSGVLVRRLSSVFSSIQAPPALRSEGASRAPSFAPKESRQTAQFLRSLLPVICPVCGPLGGILSPFGPFLADRQLREPRSPR